MDYMNSKWYKVINNYINVFINVIKKCIFLFVGIFIPIQIGWINKELSCLDVFSNAQLEQISDLTGFSLEKIVFYIDNITISISAMIVILAFKLSEKIELKKDSTNIHKIALYSAILIVTLKMIKSV